MQKNGLVFQKDKHKRHFLGSFQKLFICIVTESNNVDAFSSIVTSGTQNYDWSKYNTFHERGNGYKNRFLECVG